MRKIAVISIGLLFGILSLAPVSARAVEDEERAAIQKLLQDFSLAYNQKNSTSMENLFDPDGSFNPIPGRSPSRGLPSVLSEIQRIQEGDYRGADIKLSLQQVFWLGKRAAWVEALGHLENVVTPGGNKLPPVPFFSVSVLKKVKKKWVLQSMKFYSAMPILRPRR